MLIALDMQSAVPIYVQLRNQIVVGIGRGKLRGGERLPTVRRLAQDAGVNTMTVNKTYQILKAEGFIETDRRRGAVVCRTQKGSAAYREKLTAELELICAEACFRGMERGEFLGLCGNLFAAMQPSAAEA